LTKRLIAEANERIHQLRSVLDDITGGEKLCELPPGDRTARTVS
jgi:hypothetical protein